MWLIKGRRLSPSALVAVPVFWHTSYSVFAPSSRPVFAPPSRPVFGLRASVFAHHLLRLLKSWNLGRCLEVMGLESDS